MDEEAGDEVLADLNDIIEILRTKDVEELYEAYELGQSNQTIEKDDSTVENQRLNGRSNIQALFEEFGQSNFIYDIERDENGHLTHLFFAHPLSIEMTKTYSNVFVMDCTYKTNKFKMPLLDVVGMNSFNGSFYSCFAFLRKEEESDYIWALKRFNKILGGIQPQVIVSDREIALINAIKVVFPNTGHLLCIWHIEKNILAKCKRLFDDKERWDTFMSTWTNLIQSPDQLSFDRNMNLFETQYTEKASLLNYINTTWIPYKERFVFAWTNNFLHLGNHATSRAEGAHAILKQYLNVSTGDFRDVKDKISLAIENQYQEIKARVASEKVRVPHKFRIPLFRELVCHISVFALSQLYRQYELATIPGALINTCKSQFINSMGLPCAHKIKELSEEGILHLSDIHPQWRIDTISFPGSISSSSDWNDDIDVLLKEFQDKYHKLPLVQKEDSRRTITQFLNAPPLVALEPEMIPHKGRPIGSKNKRNQSSTTRDPSAFEIRDMRKCSKCQGTGHNSRTCTGKVQGI